MNLTRRGFLAALAAMPVVGRGVPKESLHDGYLEGLAVGTNLPDFAFDVSDFTWQPVTGIVTGVYKRSTLMHLDGASLYDVEFTIDGIELTEA